jgi:hypothetical protein
MLAEASTTDGLLMKSASRVACGLPLNELQIQT